MTLWIFESHFKYKRGKRTFKTHKQNEIGTFCKAIKATSLLVVVDLTTSLIQIFNSA